MSGLTVGEGEQLAGIQTGLSSDLAGLYTDQGQLNADMAIGIGGNLAGLEASRGASNSNIIGDTLAAFSQPPGTTINVGGAGAGAAAGGAAGGTSGTSGGGGQTAPGVPSLGEIIRDPSVILDVATGTLKGEALDWLTTGSGITDLLSAFNVGGMGANDWLPDDLAAALANEGLGTWGKPGTWAGWNESLMEQQGLTPQDFNPYLSGGFFNTDGSPAAIDPNQIWNIDTVDAFIKDDSLWNNFTEGLSDIWDNTGGALWDWAKETFL